MPASSLIFVVIVAIWAAYLLQSWSRRREVAAAARSVDDFTQAMRVLEKRRVDPSTDAAEPRPHAYSVAPARVVRSTVDVARAAPADAPRRSSPLVARRPSHTDQAEVHTMTAAHARHDSRPVRPSEHRPGTTPARPTQSPSRRAARPVSRAQRRLRGALLLVSLLWVPTSVALAFTGVLLWLSVPVSVLTVVAVLVWLRTEAQADRARAGGRRRLRRSPAAEPAPVLSSDDTQVIRQPQRYATAESVAQHVAQPVAQHVAQPVAQTMAQTMAARSGALHPESAPAIRPATAGASASADAGPAAYEKVFDVQAGEPAPSTTTSPPVEAAPGTWSPVPVPRPTYAMKAKAEPRYTADGIPADVFETPEFAEEAEELDERALFARRAASQ